MILDTARARVRAAGWTNVTFLATDIDIRHAVLEERFDAVVGRWFLMHLPDPVELLRRLPHLLRPGGIIAFQESDFTNPPTTFPPTEVHRQVLEWTTPSHGGPGPDLCMGSKLYRAYIEAGLDPPQLRIDAPLGGGPDWPGYAYVADTVKSLLPFLEEVGAVDPGLVDIDTLEDRLRGEVVAVDGIQLLTAVIGAWTRGPRPEPD
jgi:SAM-dependent methyltransferase